MRRQGCTPLYRFFATKQQARVGELRGGPVFDIISENEEFSYGRSGTYRVFQEVDEGIPVGSGILYADLSIALDMLPRYRRQFDPLIVLDVHFPLTAPELMAVIGEGGELEMDTEVAWEFAKHWAEPNRESRALEEVGLADVVTVPQQEWADLLSEYSDNVVVLPDVVDIDSAASFLTIFTEATLRAARQRYMSWWQRAITAPFWPSVNTLIQHREDQLREELMKRGWQ